MLSLKNIVVGLTALAVPSLCQTSAQQAANYNDLSAKTAALIPIANTISMINGPLVIVDQGPFPPIIRGFSDIVNTGNTYVSQQQNAASVPAGAQSDAVVKAFSAFVKQQTSLVNILAQKAGLFTTAPFIGAPIVQVLRQDEAVVDALVTQTAGLVPSRSDEIRNLGSSLNSAIVTAQTAYEGAQTGGSVVRRSAEGRVAKMMVA
ncbi:hypothetical protein BST61_g5722 [Cercospora zeina]